MRPIPLYFLVQRRKNRQTRPVRKAQRRFNRLGLGLWAALSLLTALLAMAGAAAYIYLTDGLPSIAQLPALLNRQDGQLLQPTRIYDRSGTHLLYTFDNPGVPRRFLTLDPTLPNHLDPQLVQAVVALEQPDFWQSSGAAWQQLTQPQPLTLAERLVDTLLLDSEPQSLRRSLRMRLLAAQVVGEYGRTQVLEWYLNSASFGHLTLGADNAARLYLGKSASQLDMGEVALLLAALKAPALNPIDAPVAALENQRTALMRLLENGIISSEEYLLSRDQPPFMRSAVDQANAPARAFSSLVINELSNRFGRNRLERGGLVVITTLDYDLQQQVSCVLRTQLARMQARQDPTLPGGQVCDAARLLPSLSQTRVFPIQLSASAVLTDPSTGQILAYVGDTTLSGEQPALLAHEPGSTLSPFLAVAAFVRGFNPASLVWDIPPAGSTTSPDQTYHGPVRLRLAIANDYLAAQTSLLQQIGPITAWRSAAPFGLGSLADASDEENLLAGGGHLTPLELASAYGVFASQGVRYGAPGENGVPAPLSVLNVSDASGQVLLDQSQSVQLSVLSPQLAYLVHHIISDEAARWPSLGHPNPLEIGRPAGVRLSQLPQSPQTWTVGYTRHYSTAVWLGLPAGEAANLDPRYAAGIWHALMLFTERDLPVEDWSEPSGIVRLQVCDPSGLLPSYDCPTRVTEVFQAGSEPTSVDSLYRTYTINRETGRLATVFTPPAWIEERTYLVVPPEAREWARQAGIEAPPSAYDSIQAPAAQADVNITRPGLFAYVSGTLPLTGTAAGEEFSSFRVQVGQGIQPQSWLQVGTDSNKKVLDGALAEWDTTQQADGLYAVRLTVLRQDSRIDTAVIQVTVDNTPPEVKLIYPLAGQTISRKQDPEITLLASAQDTIGIERVEWWLDGIRVGERSQEPYSLPWKVSNGTHTLTCVVYDLAGNRANSDKIEFVVNP